MTVSTSNSGLGVRLPFQRHVRNVSSISDASIWSNSNASKTDYVIMRSNDSNADLRVVLLCDSESERRALFEALKRSIFSHDQLSDPHLLNSNWEQSRVQAQSQGQQPTQPLGVTPSYSFSSSVLPLSVDCHQFFRFSSGSCTFRLLLLSKDKQNLLKLFSFDILMVGIKAILAASALDDNIWEFEFKRLYKLAKKAVAPIVLLGYLRFPNSDASNANFESCSTIQTSNEANIDLNENNTNGGRLFNVPPSGEIAAANSSGGNPTAGIDTGINIIEGSKNNLNSNVNPPGSNSTITPNSSSNSRKRKELESRLTRLGLDRACIPRLLDLTSDSSPTLITLLTDLEKLFRRPGYVLQQCALMNNLQHFQRLVESPQLTVEDILYCADEPNHDNPLMVAAKRRHKELVGFFLKSPRLHSETQIEFLREVVHARNAQQQTLLAMLALQGPEMEEQKLYLLRHEIKLHCLSELTHEADQIRLQRCLRQQLKSSAEAAVILDQARSLQGIPKTNKELKAESCQVWTRLFFASLLLSLLFNAMDTGSDLMIMVRYFREMMGLSVMSNNTDADCGEDEESSSSDQQHLLNCDINGPDPIPIHCFPRFFSPQQKFGYTLFFLVIPWPFFVYEFLTSSQCSQLTRRTSRLVHDLAHCRSPIKTYLSLMASCIVFLFCFVFWPVAVLFIKYYNDGKYYLAKGDQRAKREKKIEASELLYSTARVMEVSLESSFQPTIQLYIIFPVLLHSFTTASSFSLRIFTVCKGESFPMLKTDQTISIVTSIVGLAWCFTYYHATLKRGALDRDLAALFYRSVLFLSVLFQIVGRLFILVLFAYSFGPGKFYPVLVFLAAHILLMTALHFVFSDAKLYWERGSFLNLSFFHYMLGNGLANIYIHNWIRMDTLIVPFSKPTQHVSTLMRQLVFDLVFAAENITLLIIATNANIREVQQNRLGLTLVLLLFTIIGLVLKCVYYRYLHIWAWLILDYITHKEDGHFKCFVLSDMYLCGQLKTRKLLLCCLPRPLYSLYTTLFGERHFSSTDTSCSVCTAIFSVLLFPLVAIVGLALVLALIVLGVLFMPVFIVLILPIIVVIKCRRRKHHEDTDGDSNKEKKRATFEMEDLSDDDDNDEDDDDGHDDLKHIDEDIDDDNGIVVKNDTDDVEAGCQSTSLSKSVTVETSIVSESSTVNGHVETVKTPLIGITSHRES